MTIDIDKRKREVARLMKQKEKEEKTKKHGDYIFPSQSFGFQINNNDLQKRGFSTKEKKELEKFLNNLRAEQKFSNWVKDVILNAFRGQMTIDIKTEKIIDEFKKEREKQKEEIAEKIVKLMMEHNINFDNSINDKIKKGEGLTDEDFEKLLKIE